MSDQAITMLLTSRTIELDDPANRRFVLVIDGRCRGMSYDQRPDAEFAASFYGDVEIIDTHAEEC